MIQTLEWTIAACASSIRRSCLPKKFMSPARRIEQVADVIRTMVVRGAPAIGVAAAMGVALGVNNSKSESPADLKREFDADLRCDRQDPANGGESVLGDPAHAGKVRARPHAAHSADQAGL